MLVQLPHGTERLMALLADGWRVSTNQVCGEQCQAAVSNLADMAGGFDIAALIVRDQTC